MKPDLRPRLRRLGLGAALGLALAAMTACGGGLYIGFGGDGGDDPPDVSLASATTEAAPGDSVALAAAASDDYGIDEVRLYEVAANGSLLLLAADRSAPFQWTVVVPPAAGAAGRLRYMARAFDDAGQAADSNLVEIVVR